MYNAAPMRSVPCFLTLGYSFECFESFLSFLHHGQWKSSISGNLDAERGIAGTLTHLKTNVRSSITVYDNDLYTDFKREKQLARFFFNLRLHVKILDANSVLQFRQLVEMCGEECWTSNPLHQVFCYGPCQSKTVARRRPSSQLVNNHQRTRRGSLTFTLSRKFCFVRVLGKWMTSLASLP